MSLVTHILNIVAVEVRKICVLFVFSQFGAVVLREAAEPAAVTWPGGETAEEEAQHQSHGSIQVDWGKSAFHLLSMLLLSVKYLI